MGTDSSAGRKGRGWVVGGIVLSVATLPFVAFGLWMLYRGLMDGPGGDPAMAWFLGTMGTAAGLVCGLAAGALSYAGWRSGRAGRPASRGRWVAGLCLCWLPALVPAIVLFALGLALT